MTITDSKKAALRTELRARRAAIANDIRAEWDRSLWENINTSLAQFPSARTLLFYFPLRHEISLIPIFNQARECGIDCAFPRCGDQKGQMDFLLTDSLDQLAAGKYGIREPLASARKVTDFSNALIFVPALAFDRDGYRLGYGGGYYDRFLAAHPIPSVGVTYEHLMTDALPRDQYDRAVNIIVTESSVYHIGGQA